MKKILTVITLMTICLFSASCDKNIGDNGKVTTQINQQNTTILTTQQETVQQATGEINNVNTTQQPVTDTPVTQAPTTNSQSTTDLPTTLPPSTQETTTQALTDDTSNWTKEKVVQVLTDAVNKSKAYKNELDVDHEESFDITETSITGGQMFRGLTYTFMGLVAKPTKETIHYTNGTTTNSENETVPILLPKRNDFCLSPEGVSTATAVENDNGILVTIRLVQEVVGVLDVPVYHSQCMGYLDIVSLDVLKYFGDYDATIAYTGSTITAQLTPDGYVANATYFIPLHFEGESSSDILSGNSVFDGSQTETWVLHW